VFVTGASVQVPSGTAGGQVTGVMPGHSHLASITAGWGRYIRKITNHGCWAEVGSQFGSRLPPGEPGCR
jgi:hypothetical protein